MQNETKNAILKDIAVAVDRLLLGKLGRSQILMASDASIRSGLLREICLLIAEKNHITSMIQAKTNQTLDDILLYEIKKLTSIMSTNLTFDYDLENFLPEIFIEIGQSLKNRKLCWVLICDNLQLMKLMDIATLISAIHVANQKNLPILFIGSGSPELAKITGNAKSYSERLFQYRSINSVVL